METKGIWGRLMEEEAITSSRQQSYKSIYESAEKEKFRIFSGRPISPTEDIHKDDVMKEVEEEEDKSVYFFEIHEMFSDDIKRLFEVISTNFFSDRTLSKAHSVRDYYDQMLRWDRIPIPLNSSFWSKLSEQQRGKDVSSESISFIEDSIRKALKSFGVTVDGYIKSNYTRRNDL